MDFVLFLARIALAAIFLLSGVSKFFDRRGTAEALENFGVPSGLAPSGAILLPILEVATALALIPRTTAWWASLAALTLLLAFCVGITVNLLQGKTPDCHCFGQIYSEPIGVSTLVRNVIFALPAILVAGHGPADPGLDPFARMAAMSGHDRLLTLAAIAALVVLVILLRVTAVLFKESPHSLRDLLFHRPHDAALSGSDPVFGQGLAVTSPAPPFRLRAVAGSHESLDSLRTRGRPVMLIFTGTSCPICTELMPDIAQWQQALDDYLTLAVIAQGNEAVIQDEAARYGLTQVLLDADQEVYKEYQANGTPSGVIVQVDGTIGSVSASGPDQIHGLLAQTLGLMMLSSLGIVPSASPLDEAGETQQATLAVGDAAPAHLLRDLDGRRVDLQDLAKAQVYLLLWNSQDEACRDLETAVLDLEAQGTPLAILIAGNPNENQHIRFRSPVLIDRDDAIRRQLGMSRVPAAILLEDGRVRSRVAMGRDDVRNLLAGSRPEQRTVQPVRVDDRAAGEA
jgi:peroxiredoxin/uncharacterized membrane protein YphA (DoxX/SURF4 family)